jgi:probable rRNA maturation factor
LTANIDIDYQVADDSLRASYLPDLPTLERWVSQSLQELARNDTVQLGIRVVDEQEITQLNAQYRHKNQATNVLAFPYESLPGVDVPLLGDIVICAPVVAHQAKEQGKSAEQHWAHMVIHGVLHLLGYDHINETEADEMETTEIKILSKLGFPNPYGETNTL